MKHFRIALLAWSVSWAAVPAMADNMTVTKVDRDSDAVIDYVDVVLTDDHRGIGPVGMLWSHIAASANRGRSRAGETRYSNHFLCERDATGTRCFFRILSDGAADSSIVENGGTLNRDVRRELELYKNSKRNTVPGVVSGSIVPGHSALYTMRVIRPDAAKIIFEGMTKAKYKDATRRAGDHISCKVGRKLGKVEHDCEFRVTNIAGLEAAYKP